MSSPNGMSYALAYVHRQYVQCLLAQRLNSDNASRLAVITLSRGPSALSESLVLRADGASRLSLRR